MNNNNNIKEKENKALFNKENLNLNKLSLSEKKEIFNNLKSELKVKNLKVIKSDNLIFLEKILKDTLKKLSELRIIKKELISDNNSYTKIKLEDLKKEYLKELENINF